MQSSNFIKQSITLALQKKSVVLQILKYFEEFERKKSVSDQSKVLL